MVRTAMTTHPVHGSDANAITSIAADMEQFNNTAGRSLVVTGNQTILLFNPTGGAAVHVTVPSANDAQNRTTNLIKRFRIPGGTAVPLPKFKAQGWSQGPEGLHINADETIHSEGTLSLASSNPIEADTFTLGERVYTYTASPAAPGQIPLSVSIAAALVATAAAINGTDGRSDPNPDVAALTPGSTTLIVEAVVGGTAGDSIASTSAFDDGANGFDAATLGTTVAGGAGSARLRFLVLTDPTD